MVGEDLVEPFFQVVHEFHGAFHVAGSDLGAAGPAESDEIWVDLPHRRFGSSLSVLVPLLALLVFFGRGRYRSLWLGLVGVLPMLVLIRGAANAVQMLVQQARLETVGVLRSVPFIVMLGFGAMIPVLSLYVQSQGIDPTTIGIIISGWAIGRLISEPPFGWWADRHSRKPQMVVALALVGLTSMLMLVFTSAVELFALRFIASPLKLAPAEDQAEAEQADGNSVCGLVHGSLLCAAGRC